MTITTEYQTQMTGDTDLQRLWRQMNHIEPFEEQSPHTSEEPHVLQRGESIPVTEQEEEAWLTKMQQLAGCVA